MAVRIQLRRDTAANWIAIDPVLSLGEVGIETDTLKSKVGNGSATWTSLSYLGSQSPDFSGTPTAPTAAAGTNTTQIATTAFTIANRGDRYLTSATDSVAIGTGSKTFNVQTGLSYIATQDITVVHNASNHMHGSVTSYHSGTGVLVVNVVEATGTGTYNAWSINVGGLTTSAGTLLSANNLSDVQSSSASLANLGGVSTARQIISGTGLSGGGDLTADRTLSVSYGSTAGTACEGNDARLSDSRAPSGAAGGALTGTYPNPGLATVPVASGGTGATDTATARTNLGLAIGTNVQAYNANTTVLGNSTTGSGSIVLATSPSLTTPNIGVANGSSLAVSSAGIGQLTITSSSYTVTGALVRVFAHSGAAFEPLSVYNGGGFSNGYITRIDTCRTNLIGFGGNLNVAGTPTLGLTDSRLRLTDSAVAASLRGIDLSDTRLFNSYTSSSIYERANLYWNSNTFTIGTEAAGTGVVRPFAVATGGTNRFVIAATGEITTGIWNATAIGVAYGGTGATDAATARTNLGLAIGTDVQGFVSSTATGSGSIVLSTGAAISTPTLNGYRVARRSVSTSGNITSADVVVLASASGGVVSLALPAASTVPGQQFTIKKTDSSANSVNVTSTELIDGSNYAYLTSQYQSITVVSDGSNYFII